MSKLYCDYDKSQQHCDYKKDGEYKRAIANCKCDICGKLLCKICGYIKDGVDYCNECWKNND